MQSDWFGLEYFNCGAFINRRRSRLVGISVPQAAFCCVWPHIWYCCIVGVIQSEGLV